MKRRILRRASTIQATAWKWIRLLNSDPALKALMLSAFGAPLAELLKDMTDIEFQTCRLEEEIGRIFNKK